MDIQIKNNDIILKNAKDFDLCHIFDCGQAFRFNRTGENTYMGVASGKALCISQKGADIILHETSYKDFEEVWYEFFDLGTDYSKIKEKVSVDEYMKEATAHGGGIRILKQDLWETIISFIISASNNVPRIKGIVERLCEAFGDEISYMGKTYYSFPSPQRLSQLTKEELGVIRAGFRDKYILDAADKINSGKISLDALKKMSTDEAKKTLTSISGVGNKVSDCILLFGLGRCESFPVDVWIKRIMEYCYFDSEQSIETVSRTAQQKFGEFGGYAQQYLFFWARENKIGV